MVFNAVETDVVDPQKGNTQDRHDMTRMGKAQELKVRQENEKLAST